jgi:hypothetical protein
VEAGQERGEATGSRHRHGCRVAGFPVPRFWPPAGKHPASKNQLPPQWWRAGKERGRDYGETSAVALFSAAAY